MMVSEGANPEKGHVGEQAGGKGRSGCGFGHVDLEVVDFMQMTRGKGALLYESCTQERDTGME